MLYDLFALSLVKVCSQTPEVGNLCAGSSFASPSRVVSVGTITCTIRRGWVTYLPRE